nr:hypothetical protein [Streptomyces sp. SCL15-6]
MVWNISGSAPTASHGRPVSNGMTCAAGAVTYWAYAPSYERPMPPIIVATCCPGRSGLPSSASSTTPTPSMQGTRG